VKTKQNIAVDVDTTFLRDYSDPEELRFVFAYHIKITNNSSSLSKLLERHWKISHGGRFVESVDGTGVVGETPLLSPGESFEYTSGAVLETPFGTMEGHYTFEDMQGRRFDVPIPPFILSTSDETLN